MKTLQNAAVLRAYIERNKEMGQKIGFVPTMGALHEGHISLFEQARLENDLVVASIFVNPTQFDRKEDLEKYPSHVKADTAMLLNSGFVDALYIPKIEDLYTDGIESKSYDFNGLDTQLEGQFRPGHFTGVATVVEEFFRQVKPDVAYFGEKDFQQLLIIKKIVKLKNLPIKIVGMPIFREKNGLAMSSRNERLSSITRERASFIYKCLQEVKAQFPNSNYVDIKKMVESQFINTQEFRLEYFCIADEENLVEITNHHPTNKYRAFIAAFAGEVRLIDNIAL